jgi:flavin reductase (DIM6/NTAB) family NADH-FMN oxidoreductase RutF/DNA-binding IclR family transcriptional regulator
MNAVINPLDYRRVLGNFPTGVVVVTAALDEGPVGMVVGSFTSVSLDPPLVAFLPMKSSSSFQKLSRSTTFCVNFLGAHQEALCRTFASKAPDKFAGLDWLRAPSGSPILPGVTGWVDCALDTVHDAGDHVIVVGRVNGLSTGNDIAPLLFFRGGYGRFSTSSLVAGNEPDLLTHLKLADVARPFIEELAGKLDLVATVTVRSGREIVLLASAGQATVSRLGERVPFAPPLGAVHAAWETPDVVALWIANLGADAMPADQTFAETLERVRRRGWSIGVDGPRHRKLQAEMAKALSAGHSPETVETLRRTVAETAMTHDPEVLAGADGLIPVGVISAPVRTPSGHAAFGISLTGFDRNLDRSSFDGVVSALLSTCGETARAIARYF